MIVCITGGASGLGESITRKIAQCAEHTVYFTYLNSVAQAKQIEKEFSNAVGIPCDFKNKDDIERLQTKIKDLNIDVLINNAYTGDFLKSYFHKTAPEDFESGFATNVLPTIQITQAAIGVFRKKKFGKIITILTAALISNPPIGSSVYVANKAYLEQLAKIWATENIKFNITSNTISPAFMRTGFTGETDERVVEQMTANHPLHHLLSTEEVADSVLFLIGATQQINGIDILLNAGHPIK